MIIYLIIHLPSSLTPKITDTPSTSNRDNSIQINITSSASLSTPRHDPSPLDFFQSPPVTHLTPSSYTIEIAGPDQSQLKLYSILILHLPPLENPTISISQDRKKQARSLEEKE